MQTVTIQDRQTLFDIAIQYCGDREAVFQIADLNDLPITEELLAGSFVKIPVVFNQKIVNYYQTNSIIPATEVGTEINNIENGIVTNNEQYAMVTNNDINTLIITNNG